MKALASILIIVLMFASACEIMPRNSLSDCQKQCKDRSKSKACYEFCDCIHKYGHTLDSCLHDYDKAPKDSIRSK